MFASLFRLFLPPCQLYIAFSPHYAGAHHHGWSDARPFPARSCKLECPSTLLMIFDSWNERLNREHVATPLVHMRQDVSAVARMAKVDRRNTTRLTIAITHQTRYNNVRVFRSRHGGHFNIASRVSPQCHHRVPRCRTRRADWLALHSPYPTPWLARGSLRGSRRRHRGFALWIDCRHRHQSD